MVNVHSNHSTNNTKVYVISLGTSKEEKSHIEQEYFLECYLLCKLTILEESHGYSADLFSQPFDK